MSGATRVYIYNKGYINTSLVGSINVGNGWGYGGWGVFNSNNIVITADPNTATYNGNNQVNLATARSFNLGSSYKNIVVKYSYGTRPELLGIIQSSGINGVRPTGTSTEYGMPSSNMAVVPYIASNYYFMIRCGFAGMSLTITEIYISTLD